MAKEKKTTNDSNFVTVNNEQIDITKLENDSISYLNHLFDLDKQAKELDFKLQQVRTARAAFLSLFDKSRKKE
jgi:hypothetical protein|tara:strand:- start:161 stop:379 length:219 start_codon:yes stop_codon:yes gene_type:complete